MQTSRLIFSKKYCQPLAVRIQIWKTQRDRLSYSPSFHALALRSTPLLQPETQTKQCQISRSQPRKRIKTRPFSQNPPTILASYFHLPSPVAYNVFRASDHVRYFLIQLRPPQGMRRRRRGEFFPSVPRFPPRRRCRCLT
jgi:hypothetical protein